MTAKAFQEQAAHCVASRLAVRKKMLEGLWPLTDDELERVRAWRAELLFRCTATRAGGASDLVFVREFAGNGGGAHY